MTRWEIANRNNIFTPVGLKRFAFLANSDFHKPKHIYSWKTLLHCEKDPEAIKDCIRRNEHVSLTLYPRRDERRGPAERSRRMPEALPPEAVSFRAGATRRARLRQLLSSPASHFSAQAGTRPSSRSTKDSSARRASPSG